MDKGDLPNASNYARQVRHVTSTLPNITGNKLSIQGRVLFFLRKGTKKPGTGPGLVCS